MKSDGRPTRTTKVRFVLGESDAPKPALSGSKSLKEKCFLRRFCKFLRVGGGTKLPKPENDKKVFGSLKRGRLQTPETENFDLSSRGRAGVSRLPPRFPVGDHIFGKEAAPDVWCEDFAVGPVRNGNNQSKAIRCKVAIIAAE